MLSWWDLDLSWCCNGLKLFSVLGWDECIFHVGWTCILVGHRLDRGRKHNGPQRCLHPEIWNLRIYCFTWQREIKVVDRITVANQLIQRQWNYLRWNEWAQCNHEGPSMQKREAGELVLEWCTVRKTQVAIVGSEGGRCPWGKEFRNPLEAVKGKEWILS